MPREHHGSYQVKIMRFRNSLWMSWYDNNKLIIFRRKAWRTYQYQAAECAQEKLQILVLETIEAASKSSPGDKLKIAKVFYIVVDLLKEGFTSHQFTLSIQENSTYSLAMQPNYTINARKYFHGFTVKVPETILSNLRSINSSRIMSNNTLKCIDVLK